MSLRDITNETHFKSISFDLHKAINANPNMSRQALQNELAKAMGARSLEDFKAQCQVLQVPPEAEIENNVNPMWQTLRDSAYVIVNPGTNQAVHGGDYSPYTLDTIKEGLVVLTQSDAEAMAASPEQMGFHNASLRAEKLSIYAPDFFDFLTLSAEEMPIYCEKYATDNHSWNDCPYLYLDRESWQHEASEGNINTGYWPWVEQQLEDFFTEHFGAFPEHLG